MYALIVADRRGRMAILAIDGPRELNNVPSEITATLSANLDDIFRLLGMAYRPAKSGHSACTYQRDVLTHGAQLINTVQQWLWQAGITSSYYCDDSRNRQTQIQT